MGICHSGRSGFIVQPARHSLPECLKQGQELIRPYHSLDLLDNTCLQWHSSG
jgi:hypothetical protein